MQNRHKLLSLLALSLLAGCTPNTEETSRMLAVSPTRLESMPSETKRTLIHNYRVNLAKRQQVAGNSRTTTPKRLSVQINDGTAAIAPTYQQHNFFAQTVSIHANQCQEVSLASKHDKNQFAHLILCYLNNQLYIDPSSTDLTYPVGSVIIPIENALSTNQSFCGLNTQGNAHLKKTCLTISMVNKKANGTHKTLHGADKNQTFKPSPRSEYDTFQ